ncbi:MAG: hydrogenase small subunit [Chloroflexota bacterium]
MAKETIYEHLHRAGFSRRDFIKVCGALAGLMGLRQAPPVEAGGLPGRLACMAPESTPTQWVARALESRPRLPVIWLELQSCTGCSEALTRSHAPTMVDLVLNKISLEYHETLSAAAGFQAEEHKAEIMRQYAGQYLLLVEGSIPTGPEAKYCAIGGRTAEDILTEAAAGAAAIIATGNCAAFGGVPRAGPNPTGAKGMADIITDKPVVNIPGCPAIPAVTAGTLVHYLVFGNFPELDNLHRPKTFYAQTIHDRCLRRPFYDAGKFANSFDDEGARRGWCLYKLGCKGPITYNACAGIKWEAGLSFPIQSGHPCLGCSEPNFWDGGGFYQGQSAPLSRPTLVMAGAAAVAGAVVGAGAAMVNRAQKQKPAQEEAS